jgi:hypothetical protein
MTDPVTNPSRPPMDAVRGTIMLCDQVYPTAGGKWIIAGTYTNWWTSESPLVFTGGLSVYIRFQVEQSGDYPCRILLIDRMRSANDPPIVEVGLTARISDPLEPFELGLKFPQFGVKCPIDPGQIPAGRPIGLVLSVWLQVLGKDLASCPLRVIFRNPQDIRPNDSDAPPSSEDVP